MTDDELVGRLMEHWGCDQGDEDCYDTACRDIDFLRPLIEADVEVRLRRVQAAMVVVLDSLGVRIQGSPWRDFLARVAPPADGPGHQSRDPPGP